MATVYKSWAALGLSTTMLGSLGLAACGNEAAAPASETAAPAPAETEAESQTAEQASPAPSNVISSDGESGGEGGEGEGGEGGVNIAAAAEDPAVYLSALALVEAHIRAGIDALDAGEREAAGEMFAHPVSEILFDLQPVLEQQGVEPFEQKLIEASHAAFGDETSEELRARADDIIATIRAAGEAAPDSEESMTIVKVRVVADEIDRAISQYSSAHGNDAYEPYLDGYGFYKTAEAMLNDNADAIETEAPALAAQMGSIIEALGEAYPTATRPETLDADASALAIMNSGLQLELSAL